MASKGWLVNEPSGVAFRRVNGCSCAPVGCVAIGQRNPDGDVEGIAHLTPYEWASIVAAVSANSPSTSTREFLTALAFHLEGP